MFRPVLISTSALSLFVALGMPAAAAPPESGLKIAVNVGASMGDGNTSVATGGTIGYRFNRNIGFDVEVSYTPSLEFNGGGASRPFGMAGVQPGNVSSTMMGPNGVWIGVADQTFDPPMSERTSGNMLTFLASFVGEIPTGVSWFRPYVLAGVGAATVTEKYGVTNWTRGPGSMGQLEYSQTSLALTAGGGVDFPIWKALAVGVDARYIHVAREGGPLNTVRAGTQISYRF